jgi:hypothetical protein
MVEIKDRVMLPGEAMWDRLDPQDIKASTGWCEVHLSHRVLDNEHWWRVEHDVRDWVGEGRTPTEAFASYRLAVDAWLRGDML